jgi:hypothetical protein
MLCGSLDGATEGNLMIDMIKLHNINGREIFIQAAHITSITWVPALWYHGRVWTIRYWWKRPQPPEELHPAHTAIRTIGGGYYEVKEEPWQILNAREKR